MALDIETAKSGEWDEILKVTLAAYEEYARDSSPEFWSNYQKSIERTILTDDSITRIVAREGDKIVGAVLFCSPYEKVMGGALVKNPFPEMRLLAISPAHRNRGIGALLIDFCEVKARAEGWPTITLHTTVLMQTAKQMYERRGYERYTDIDFVPVPGFTVWGYRKDIAVPVARGAGQTV
ncbi:MAG TPA: GNAT family N-acetyltransferase [Planktothrix sp.]|jgi:ribosomal protein S18 acetylase RimI-like enzyme